MSDQSVGDRAEPGMVPGIERPEESPPNAPRSRKPLWISLAAIGALSALSFPITLHFAHRSPAQLHVPNTVAGLTLDKSADAAGTADYLRSAIAAGMSLQTSVGGVYTDGVSGSQADAHSVILVGGTTTQGTNASQVSGLLGLMDDSTDGVSGLTQEDPGSSGGLMKCGLATDTSPSPGSSPTGAPAAPQPADTEMAICAFANKGTVGIALFANRSVADSAALMRQMRPGLQSK